MAADRPAAKSGSQADDGHARNCAVLRLAPARADGSATPGSRANRRARRCSASRAFARPDDEPDWTRVVTAEKAVAHRKFPIKWRVLAVFSPP
jgi:hypothetical protein